MTRKQRHILFVTFVILFFISGAIIILYASGFRYDQYQRRFIATGSIALKTEPEKVDIILNDQTIDQETPTVINNLIPGSYFIKLQKEGYASWEKNVSVSEKKVTLLEDIYLFKKNKRPQVILQDIVATYPLKNHTSWLCLTKENNVYPIYLYDLATSQGKKITTIEQIPENIYPINEETFLIEKKGASSRYALFSKKQWQPYEKFTKIEKIISVDKNWYVLSEHQLLQTSESGVQTTMVVKNVENFYIQDKNIYVLKKNDRAVSLHQYEGEKKLKLLGQFPPSEYTFISGGKENAFLLLDKKNQNVYTISVTNVEPNTEKIEIKAKDVQWNKEGNRLLLTNDFEISIYDVKDEKHTLITRQTKILESTAWYSHENHIIASDNDGIHIFELNTFGSSNKITIYPSQVEILGITQDGRNMIFQEKNNISSLEIR